MIPAVHKLRLEIEESLRSFAFREHLIAFLYVLLASGLVFIFEGVYGLRLEVTFGVRFQRHLIFPVAYWVLTAVYALLTLPRDINRKEHFRKILILGLVLHISLLCMEFVRTGVADQLNASYFTLYCNSVCIGFILVSILMPGYDRKDPVLLPLSYLIPCLPFTMGFKLGIASAALALFLLFIGNNSLKVRSFFAKVVSVLLTEKYFLMGLFALALLMRATAAYRLGSMGEYTVTHNADDAPGYFLMALDLLSGKTLTSFYSPGAPAAFLVFFKMAGGKLAEALLIQSFFYSTVPLAVYLIAKGMFDAATARVASILAALSQLLIFNSVNITREGPGAFLLMWSLVTLFYFFQSTQTRKILAWASTLGILSGLAVLVEPVFQPLYFLCFLGVLFNKNIQWQLRLSSLVLVVFIHFALLQALQFLFLGKIGFMVRDMSSLAYVSYAYNIYAEKLYVNGVNPFYYPQTWIASFFLAPMKNGMLLGLKLITDFVGYFFESYSGMFDPTVLVRNSTLAATLSTYGNIMGITGVLWAIRKVITNPLKNGKIFALLCFSMGYAAFYILLVFGATRYRASIQPIILIWVALGISACFHYGNSATKRFSP